VDPRGVARVTTNYVIAAFMGDRIRPAPCYDLDRTAVLRTHLDSLAWLKHDLSQITLVVSGQVSEDDEAFLAGLPTHLREAKLIVQRRDNTGMSYGAFSDAFAMWGAKFTHFIFTEDDYCFTQDHFDRWLCDEIERMPSCGFLCGGSWVAGPETWPHAAIFLGIARSDALAKAAAISGGALFYDRESPVPVSGFYGQKGMSKAIIDTGYSIENWLMSWATAYWDSEGGIVRWFSHEDNHSPQGQANLSRASFVIPVQAIGTPVRVSDGVEWHDGYISNTGRFMQ